MSMYQTLEQCIIDLEENGHLVRVREPVDPYLEMAAIHLKVHAAGGPALLFEQVKGSKFRAVSNLFGTLERSRFMFRKTWDAVQQVIALRNDPMKALKHPLRHMGSALTALKALPKKSSGQSPVLAQQIRISDLPLIHHWPDDGGAFITLPQVYTEDRDKPGVMGVQSRHVPHSIDGQRIRVDQEVGLHYQIHRGIGIHQRQGEPARRAAESEHLCRRPAGAYARRRHAAAGRVKRS